MAKMGRPTIYSDELCKKICEQLADGKSLRSICEAKDMPTKTTILNWACDLKHPFFDHYARARDIQADVHADELIDIADDGVNDFYYGKNGPIVDNENIQRSRLRVDTRKWIASKLKPRKYGDKLFQEITEGKSPEEIRRKMIAISKDPEGMKALEKIREITGRT